MQISNKFPTCLQGFAIVKPFDSQARVVSWGQLQLKHHRFSFYNCLAVQWLGEIWRLATANFVKLKFVKSLTSGRLQVLNLAETVWVLTVRRNGISTCSRIDLVTYST